METIWKYKISEIGSVVFLDMPRDAEILTVQLQDNNITLWAKICKNKEIVVRKIIVVGTGFEQIMDGWKYIATLQQDWLVLHIFEIV